MPRNIAWIEDVGRRLRLRDLHVFFTVVRCGSMAKAAAELHISQPSISIQIGGLENMLGVRLFDRTTRGVELTPYGTALLQRGQAAFDELKQGIRDIEFLSDPTAGGVKLGCPELIASGILPPIIARLHEKYPRVAVELSHVTTNPPDLHALRERKLDLIICPAPWTGASVPDDYDLEILLNDTIRVVVGAKSPLTRRRKISFRELADEPWIMTLPGTPTAQALTAAFRSVGRDMPQASLQAYSMHMRNHLLCTGRYVSTMAQSVLRLNAIQFGLKTLPVELPRSRISLGIITMKRRTLTPVVKLLLESARAVARTLSAEI
jgi:DNA-binding transcriptional LysR family regulator